MASALDRTARARAPRFERHTWEWCVVSLLILICFLVTTLSHLAVDHMPFIHQDVDIMMQNYKGNDQDVDVMIADSV